GNWNEGLSSGQGLMAIALVIFARWSPMRCFYASLLFGGASAIGPAVQTVGITEGYYLFYAAPYVLTLGLMEKLTSAPPEVEVIDLAKSFDHVRALDAVSVKFRAGRLHALLGENGA